MIGPCLPNLRLIKLVNVSLSLLGLPVSAKAFFSLHYVPNDSEEVTKGKENESDTGKLAECSEKSDLLYVSEVVTACTRMNFGMISLPSLPQMTYRLRLKIWVSPSENDHRFSLILDISVDVRNLVLLDHELVMKEGDSAFNANAIIWKFDGHDYCLKTDLREPFVNTISQTRSASKSTNRKSREKRSYTIDDARHIGSLVLGLRDFDSIRLTTSDDIETSLKHNASNLESCQAKQRRLSHEIAVLDQMIARQESANESLEAQILAMRNRVKEAKHTIESYPAYEKLILEKQDITASQVAPLYESLADSVYPHILSATHNIVSIINDAFPITLADTDGHYSISGIEFPHSIKEILSVCYYETPSLRNSGSQLTSLEPKKVYDSSVECVNAGLSQIVSALKLLSLVTAIPLKYEMAFNGSKSVLIERLSPQQVIQNNKSIPLAMHASTTVTYPLYYDAEESRKFSEGIPLGEGQIHPRNVRFECGLALLSRNLTVFVSELADAYSRYNGSESMGNSAVGSVPLDCADHFLWILHYIMLYLTAPTK
ncbi:hypothetical protein OXX59_008208 [Metschnikowia pulcherrima]